MRITDPLGRTRTRVVDVAGRLRRVTDPSPGGTTIYDYDSLGSRNRIQDPIGAVSSGTYNLRGFRTHGPTPTEAPGRSPDSLERARLLDGREGPVVRRVLRRSRPRTSAHRAGRHQHLDLGLIGRRHNVGSLKSATGYGYAESLAYDGMARLARRTITTDQAYQYDYSYNSIGALDTITYPASPVPAGQGGTRFKAHYAYSYGRPIRITDVTQPPGTVLWTLNAANDYASATSESIGERRDRHLRLQGVDQRTDQSTRSGIAPATEIDRISPTSGTQPAT